MKQQFHRSVTFWSGLLVMAFVCWAWWDSLSQLSCIRLSHGEITNAAGGVRATYAGRGNLSPRMERTSVPTIVGQDENHGVIFEVMDLPTIEWGSPWFWSGHGQRQLFIPHWLILLTVAAVWLALLFWRARRRKRTITP